MGRLRVGLDSYGLEPLGLDPLAVVEWAAAHGAEGVQFSGVAAQWRPRLDEAYLRDLRALADADGLYLEWGGASHIPRDLSSGRPRDLRELLAVNRQAVEQAEILGASVVRSCSGGLMRWRAELPPTETLLRETASALRAQRSMLRDHGVTLAVELHFEFTTHELLRLFEMCEVEPGDCFGIVLDTMNVLTMLEDPVQATERVLPWVVATHVKDGGLRLAPDGLESFPTAIGRGVVDLPAIVERLAGVDPDMNLSVEDHGGGFTLPIRDRRFLNQFPDLTVAEFADLVALVVKTERAAEAGTCTITAREAWPDLCQGRMAENLVALRQIVERAAS